MFNMKPLHWNFKGEEAILKNLPDILLCRGGENPMTYEIRLKNQHFSNHELLTEWPTAIANNPIDQYIERDRITSNVNNTDPISSPLEVVAQLNWYEVLSGLTWLILIY